MRGLCSAIFMKGGGAIFCDFLFAFVDDKAILLRTLFLKESVCNWKGIFHTGYSETTNATDNNKRS